MSKKRWFVVITLLFIGIGVMGFPYINRFVTEYKMTQEVQKIKKFDSSTAYASTNAKKKHRNVAPGYLSVPKLGIEYPIHEDSSKKTLNEGVGIIVNLDRPGDGTGSLTAIPGHRGWWGTPMFLNLPQMQPGDVFTISWRGEKLYYRVYENKIFLANELDKVQRFENEERLILVTCHPYGKNTHRFLVYADRINNKGQKMVDVRSKADNKKQNLANYRKPSDSDAAAVANAGQK
ncbi:class C sortase [Periweissella cryptocerci]|nr:class C sortase [Periweissella cryptocerci]